MKVIVETTPLGRPGTDRGLGRYTRAVLAGAALCGFDLTLLAVQSRTGRTAEFRDLIERQARVWRSEHDVFHATNPHVSVVHTPARLVATILDIIPLDLPTYRQTGIKGRLFFSLAARADCILTLSPFTAHRISARLGIPDEKIVVAPLPPGPPFRPRRTEEVANLRARLGLPNRYVSGLADLRTPDPRKRHGWLREIGARMSAQGVQLVLAGAGTEAWDQYPGIRGIGRISDEELAVLFTGAACYVGTSAYEGQGLPALEAMACGTPVVAMNNSSIPGVVGDGGLLVNEPNGGNVGDIGRNGGEAIPLIADACIYLAEDSDARSELSSTARKAARRFSPLSFAEGLAKAYTGEASPVRLPGPIPGTPPKRPSPSGWHEQGGR